MAFTILADVFTYVQRTTDLSTSEVVTLLALANYADREQGQCWPSVATLCRTTKLSSRHQRRVLHALWERGVIEVELSLHHSSSLYRLCVLSGRSKQPSATTTTAPVMVSVQPATEPEERKAVRAREEDRGMLPRLWDVVDLTKKAWKLGLTPASPLWGLMTSTSGDEGVGWAT